MKPFPEPSNELPEDREERELKAAQRKAAREEDEIDRYDNERNGVFPSDLDY